MAGYPFQENILPEAKGVPVHTAEAADRVVSILLEDSTAREAR